MSEPPKIYSDIASIMNGIEAISKSKKNQTRVYIFKGIDDMYNALSLLFKKNRVFITSNVLETRREERTNKSGSVLIYTILKCEFTFHAIDGSSISSIMVSEAIDLDYESIKEAISAALKNTLREMFLILNRDNVITTRKLEGKEKLLDHDISYLKSYLRQMDRIIDAMRARISFLKTEQRNLETTT